MKPPGRARREVLRSCSVPNTGGWQSWQTFKARIKPLNGVQTVCLTFDKF